MSEPSPRMYAWVSMGHPDSLPDRPEVSECSRCAALVRVERSGDHAAWHKRLDRTRGRPG